MQALLNSLTDSERELVYQTERAQLILLDEDELVALHGRIRQARDKYVGLYRRQSSSRVRSVGGRGKAYAKGTRDRGKAEVFEEALARVSRRLAAAAQASALEFKQERIAEARAARDVAVPRAPRKAPARMAPQRSDRRPRTPVRAKRHGAAQASTARVQARRDAR